MEMVKKYYLKFMMYAIIGWCYEVFLEVFIYGWGFSNRGVLFGPYCPVYGFGALAFLICFHKLLKNKYQTAKSLTKKYVSPRCLPAPPARLSCLSPMCRSRCLPLSPAPTSTAVLSPVGRTNFSLRLPFLTVY